MSLNSISNFSRRFLRTFFSSSLARAEAAVSAAEDFLLERLSFLLLSFSTESLSLRMRISDSRSDAIRLKWSSSDSSSDSRVWRVRWAE